MKTLEGFRVAILATDGVEQAELDDPRKALNNARAHTSVDSLGHGTSLSAAIHSEYKRGTGNG